MRYSRREFVGRAAALPFALRGLAAAQAAGWRLEAGRGRPMWVFMGTDTGKGVYRAAWDFTTGTLGPAQLAGDASRPSYLARHPKLAEVLYAVDGVSGAGAGVSSFHVDAASGGLTLLNEVGSQGDGPCFVSVDPTGTMLFVANYAGGSFAAFQLGETGRIGQAIGVFKYSQPTHGPVADRQDAAHIHCAVVAPGNGYVLACDLGDDVILIFPVGPGRGDYVRVPLRVQARAGSGPRHVAFHPNGNFVYCIHELDCTIDMYDWRMENSQPVMKLRENSVVSTLDEGMSTKGQTACEIVISDDGRFLYSCTRGEDTITVWRIDENGYLTRMQKLSAGGKTPRYIVFDPSKRWLVCCNQGAPGNVAVFSRDAATGRLGEKPKTFAAPTPMFALWM